MSRLRAPSLSGLAVGTTVLTGVLMVLGVWTAVGGYGLTCAGRWPFCDGAVYGLFPRNFGSFVEWFHRLVAMVTGFAILGTTVAAWRAGAPTRVRAAFGAALVLTPLQVVLGALTVTEYELLILAAHFGSALAILTLLVAGTARLLDGAPSVSVLAATAAATLPIAALLTPGLVVAPSVGLHVATYALAIGGYAALLLAVARSGAAGTRPGLLAAVGAAVAAAGLVVGRVAYEPSGRALGLLALLAAAAFAAVAAWLARREDASTRARPVGGDPRG